MHAGDKKTLSKFWIWNFSYRKGGKKINSIFSCISSPFWTATIIAHGSSVFCLILPCYHIEYRLQTKQDFPIYNWMCHIGMIEENDREISFVWNTFKDKTTWQIEVHSKYLEGQANTNAHNQHSLQGWLIALGLVGSIASCRLKCVHLCGNWRVGWCWEM